MRLTYTLVIGLILASCAHSETETRTPVQIKEDLRRAELHSPTMYLRVSGELKEDSVFCLINNTAKEADYPNAIIAVNYFNDSRQLIKSELINVGNQILKGTTINFNSKVDPPDEYASVSFSVREVK
ncbi:MAG TPA: hypothetical protein PK511_09690 [Chitinophagales bacterium]|nr:hypothetical protein [Chitinophagales bacterium]HMX03605.1 hypothetical protein [Chitinophagales bacterium]HMZ89567.1 hypothetical protein [Chitinophagales bacterium]HNA57969.1 hypothetical protein [Chitinophagales bacterium]HNE47088.1 hypothetical protein [Chitinophagales bacterium]